VQGCKGNPAAAVLRPTGSVRCGTRCGRQLLFDFGGLLELVTARCAPAGLAAESRSGLLQHGQLADDVSNCLDS